MLSAELQRATVVRRLERIQGNPARKLLLGWPRSAASVPLLLKLRRSRGASRVRECAPYRRSARAPQAEGAVPVSTYFTYNLNRYTKEIHMLYWAAVFFIIALIAAVLGFGGIAAGAAGIAKILFFIFLDRVRGLAPDGRVPPLASKEIAC